MNAPFIPTGTSKSSKIDNFFYDLFLIFQSTYSFKDKWEMFRVVTKLTWKFVLNSDSDFEVTQRIFNFKITSYGFENLIYLFRHIFLQREYYFYSTNSCPRIIDCGANIGMSVLYFKFLYPECSITAFEPNPLVFLLLKRNIEQNYLSNVELKNTALFNEEKPIDFFTDGKRKCLIASIFKERGKGPKITVQATKLSTFINTDIFDLIKIDIEGAEPEVLLDLVLENKLQNSKAYIIEYHHRINTKYKNSLSSFIRSFEENGFGYNLKCSFSKLGGFQDILLCFYKEPDELLDTRLLPGAEDKNV